MVENKDNSDLITSYKNQIIKNLNDIIIKFKIFVNDNINKNIIDILYVQFEDDIKDISEDYIDAYKNFGVVTKGNTINVNNDNYKMDYLISTLIKDYDMKNYNKYYKHAKVDCSSIDYNDDVLLYEIIDNNLKQLLIQNHNKKDTYKLLNLKIKKEIYDKITFDIYSIGDIIDKLLDYNIDSEDNNYLFTKHKFPLNYSFIRILKDYSSFQDEEKFKYNIIVIQNLKYYNIDINDIIYFNYFYDYYM